MAIDMHVHWFPDALVDALRSRNRFPFVDKGEDGRDVLHYPGMSQPIAKGYTSLNRRLEAMQRYGVDVQLLSLGNRMLNAMQCAPAEVAAPLCRTFNDGASAACAAHPGKFFTLAMLPYADVSAAEEELARALTLPGIVGATLPGGGFLDYATAERYRPVLAAAQKSGGAHFLVHDCYLFEDYARIEDRKTDNRTVREDTLQLQSHLSSIMVTFNMTDLLDDYPDVTVQVHNLGGNTAFEISRMDHIAIFGKSKDELPSRRYRRTLVDCNSFAAPAIELAVSLYGADRMMMGTDGTDFGTEWSLKAIEEARIAPAEKRAILSDTAASLLGVVADA
jgi:predicted TIM-barrel fold metal-dependent hydrolase